MSDASATVARRRCPGSRVIEPFGDIYHRAGVAMPCPICRRPVRIRADGRRYQHFVQEAAK
jgi:hypothetical protein